MLIKALFFITVKLKVKNHWLLTLILHGTPFFTQAKKLKFPTPPMAGPPY